MKRFLFSLLSFSIIFIGCSKTKEEVKESAKKTEVKKYDYYLLVEGNKVKLYENIEADSLGWYGIDTIISEPSFEGEIKLGYYENSLTAAEKGLTLYLDSLVTNYEVVKVDSTINNIFEDFVFVGKYLNDRPALYSANLKKKKYKLLWSRWGRKILTLDFSPSNDYAFFLTAYRFGKNSSFPHLIETKLFSYNDYTQEVNQIRDLGKGISFFGLWQKSIEYKTIFTSIDTTITSNLKQITSVYDKFGKLISDSVKTYDLEKDGFPEIKKERRFDNSPNNDFVIVSDSENGNNIYKVLRTSDNKTFNIYTGKYELDKVIWQNNHYLITKFNNKKSVVNVDSTNSKIIIGNLQNYNIDKEITLNGLRNIKVFSDLLIYDDGFGKDAEIIFYNYRRGEEYWRIKVPGGCGVKNIPVK